MGLCLARSCEQPLGVGPETGKRSRLAGERKEEGRLGQPGRLEERQKEGEGSDWCDDALG